MNPQLGAPLPAGPGLLLGREHDLSRVTELLHTGCWLITLRGPGGIGKTALALHLAQWVQGMYGHVQFVDLSALRDPGEVLDVIAAQLPLPAHGGDPGRCIREFAAQTRTLLILDNFEHLLPAALDLAELKTGEGTLQIVVTSRAALRLHDEHEHPVGPLALPGSILQAASSPAVQLFVRRVQAVRPSFNLSADTTPEVIWLCELLEGVPLALELAAAHMRSYALPDLLKRLEQSLMGLRADFQDRPERLRSLGAAVQWSYELLGGDDRELFECCSLFEGSFSPAALTAVWGLPDALDRIEVLLDQSFVQRVEATDTRWKMLHPLRELAAEQLAHNPLAPTWRDRHARYFLNMIEEAIREWEQSNIDDRAKYLPHYPNILAGMVWVVGQGLADLAYRYLCAIGPFWISFGLTGQDGLLADQVLALPAPADRRMVLRALEVSTYGLWGSGHVQTRETRLRAILAICQELGDVDTAAMTNLSLADVELETGRVDQAWERVQQVLQGEPERIRMVDGVQSLAGRMNRPSVRQSAASCLMELGRHEEALQYATLARRSFREVGNRVQELQTEHLIGRLMLLLNRREEAVTLLLACLQESVAQGFRGMANAVLGWSLTRVAAEVQEWHTLVQFAAFVHGSDWEAWKNATDLPFRRDLAQAREALGDVGFRDAWAAGARLFLPDAVELAERLVQHPSTQQTDAKPNLTPREWEVLALVAQGHPDRRIARLLNISPGTASKHVSNLLSKLALHNRVELELARWAIERRDVLPS